MTVKGSSCGERRAIRRLLIANRGEIAVRIARTARTMGISTVAVYSDADVEALHVNECDEAIGIGGTTASSSYLRGEAIIAAALVTGADAIHPGYGFLSENAEFAQAVIEAGLNWVGPDPETIAAMGDKVAAKQRMAEAGVPVLVDVVVDGDMDLPAAASSIPLPIIAKAAAGGGGKGMRIISSLEDVEESVEACRREAKSAFGDDRVFLERYLPNPHHIEVQIVGDSFGNVVHLFERECSIQRRHQKVIEESPSPFVDDELRRRLCDAAVAAGKTLGYLGVGTVEFVVGEDRSIAFLEVNTRLQVEHPVTEAVTGLDLVRLQLLIAEGSLLPFRQEDLRSQGHAIEARLYAEEPAKNYLPAAGGLDAFMPAEQEGVRWDIGVKAVTLISPFYDPLIAKVIAWAPTRHEAARLLRHSLERTHIQGPPNNRDLLCAVLGNPKFEGGITTTAFLNEAFPSDASRSFTPSGEMIRVAMIVAALAGLERRRSSITIAPGWRNNLSQGQTVSFAGAHSDEIEYLARRDGSFSFSGNGWTSHVLLGPAAEGRLVATIDGRRFAARFSSAPRGQDIVWEISLPHGHVGLVEATRFALAEPDEAPGATRAPMHGTVSKLAVTEGDKVRKGDLLCIVEAMKMEHRILAPRDGVVASVGVSAGQQVETDQALVVLAEEEQ